jgi:hypothetical protein
LLSLSIEIKGTLYSLALRVPRDVTLDLPKFAVNAAALCSAPDWKHYDVVIAKGPRSGPEVHNSGCVRSTPVI